MGWEKELRDAVSAKDFSTVNFILSRKEVRTGISRSEWRCGEAPVHLAAHFGLCEMIRLFVDTGAEVNSIMAGENGIQVTVLHFAVYGNQMECVKLLLDLGADVTIDGKWNELHGTPLDFAVQKGYSNLIPILEQWKAEAEHLSNISSRSLEEMVGKIRSKPKMENELNNALAIQNKIKACEAQLTKLLEEKKNMEEKIQDFKIEPEYRNDRQIKKLIKNLSEIETLSKALQETNQIKDKKSSITTTTTAGQ